MADVCVKDLFDLKILEAIDYIKCVGKKKPTKERVLKHMVRSNLELLEEVLQMLPENLEKESILENHGDHSYHCLYLKESVKVMQRKERKSGEILTKEKVIP